MVHKQERREGWGGKGRATPRPKGILFNGLRAATTSTRVQERRRRLHLGLVFERVGGNQLQTSYKIRVTALVLIGLYDAASNESGE